MLRLAQLHGAAGDLRDRPALGHQQNRLKPPVGTDIRGVPQGVDQALTLADLYARISDWASPARPAAKVGFQALGR